MSRRTALSDKLGMLNQDSGFQPREEKKRKEVKESDEDTDVCEPPAQRKPPDKTETRRELTDEEWDEILISRSLEEEQTRRNRKKIRRVIHSLLITACVYAVFLIYGLAVTTFEYDDADSVSAQRMTKKDISEKKEYEKICFFYEACRDLYEETLLLDYRLGAGEEDPLSIAPEYESLLDTVEMLSIKTDAVTVDTGYSQIKGMLLTWIQDDIAVYLQNMSAAIAQNNMETAGNALQDKDRVYTDFMLITQNMAAFGENIKGVDLQTIRHWTPEKYIDEEINGEIS